MSAKADKKCDDKADCVGNFWHDRMSQQIKNKKMSGRCCGADK